MSQNTLNLSIALNANELLLSDEEGGASRAQAPPLAVLAFANKHSTINTSLLSLQKIYSVSKSVI